MKLLNKEFFLKRNSGCNLFLLLYFVFSKNLSKRATSKKNKKKERQRKFRLFIVEKMEDRKEFKKKLFGLQLNPFE